MPDVREYLCEEQRMGELHAKEIFEETWRWLDERGCAGLINPRLLEQYAMSMGRYIQLEKLQSSIGFISRLVNGEIKPNPLVTVTLSYLKEARAIWNEIWYIVQSNCRENVGADPQEDMMEKLLKL